MSNVQSIRGKQKVAPSRQIGQQKSNNTTQMKMRPGQTVEMEIKRMGINGEGIGYHERQVVFVPGALPGEKVLARIAKVEAKHATASLVRVVAPSEHRVEPLCPVYEECGGCSLQHMSYQAQLEMKRELVRESFARYAGLKADRGDG